MKTSVFVGTSLDGFLARVNGTFDFLSAGGTVTGEVNGYDAFFSTVDAVLMGRNTYDVVQPFSSWPYKQTPVFVLSHRPLQPAPNGAIIERISGLPHDVFSQLSNRGVEHLYIDGGLTIQQFLRAGLIQYITITRVPILIGNGIPLFGQIGFDVPLRHISTRCILGSAVQSEYAVGPSPTRIPANQRLDAAT